LNREQINADEMIAKSAQFAPPLAQIADKVFSRWASPIQGT